MIRFNEGKRTHGEQFALREILCGEGIALRERQSLRPQDFAHDLHGQIFRHARRLWEQCLQHDPAAVFASMRRERRGQMQGVAEYLDWLAGDDPCFASGRHSSVMAFEKALHEQYEAEKRAIEKRGRL